MLSVQYDSNTIFYLLFIISDFIKLFLKRVEELSDSDGTSSAGHEAYTETLAKHHPWLVRKGATVAMYALPTRQDLLIKVILPEQFYQCSLSSDCILFLINPFFQDMWKQ